MARLAERWKGIYEGALPAAVDPGTSAAMEAAVAQYAPGGGYGAGVEAAIGRGRTQAVAGGTQALVSAGLMGTTMPAGLAKKYEEEVGMPARARVEETRASAIANLKSLEAQIIQGATEAQRTRALEEYMSQLQAATNIEIGGQKTSTQRKIASGQLKLGYAQLSSQREMALAQIAGQAGGGGGYDSGGYVDVGSSYGGAGGAPSAYSASAPSKYSIPVPSGFGGSGATGSW